MILQDHLGVLGGLLLIETPVVIVELTALGRADREQVAGGADLHRGAVGDPGQDVGDVIRTDQVRSRVKDAVQPLLHRLYLSQQRVV
ncbi:MAG: hypothetical protein M3140_12170, partial [Actinomycetota bacterium]|nr:hypothetical protein [Actinomycetota bacterium]